MPLGLLLIAEGLYPLQPHGGSLETSVPGALNALNWQVAGPPSAFLQLSNSISPDGNPSIQFGSIFNVKSQNVSAILTINKTQDFSREDYIIFWLYSSPDLVSGDTSFIGLFNTPFRFSVTLTSSNANKTYGPYSIRWRGWGDFALPLHYRGALLTGPIDNPMYGGVIQSASWTDSVSLTSITSLIVTFYANPSFAGSATHSILVGGLSVSRIYSTPFEGLNALIAATAILSAFLVVPIYVVRYLRQSPPSRPLTYFRSFFSEFQFAKKHAKLLASVVLAKIVLAVLTPLSSDFIDTIYGSLPVEPYINPFANSPVVGGYMDSLGYFMYRLWLLLPVDHVNLLQIFPGNYFVPTINEGIFHFPMTPGSMLLVLLLKTPNIMADLLIAIVIYKIVLTVGKSQLSATLATTFWLLNPYNTLIIEMWANFDVLFVLPLIISVFFLVRGRERASGALLGLSVGVRLWSALLIPFFLSMVGKNPRTVGGRRLWKVITYTSIAGIFTLLSVMPYIVFSGLVGGQQNPRAGTRFDMPDIAFFFGLRLQLFDYFIIVLVTAMIGYLFILHDWWKPSSQEAGKVLLAFFVIFFALSKWLPHWLLWIMPFLAINVGLHKETQWYERLFVLSGSALALVEQSWYFASWGNSFFFFPATTPEVAYISSVLFHISGTLVIGIPLTYFLESAFVGVCLSYLLRLHRDSRLKPETLD